MSEGSAAPEGAGGSTAVTAGLAALAAGHLAVDCCAGIWPVYKTIAHLDLNLAGAIATASGVIANGLQIGFGLLGDRGLARGLLVGGILLAGAATFVPYTSHYGLLFALVLATSLGSAAFHPIAAGAAGSLSREHAGVMLALFLAGGYVGYSLSQVAFTALFRQAPLATALMSIAPALAAAGVWRWVPPAARRSPGSVTWARSLRHARRPLAVLFAVQALAATVNVSLIFLLPDLLINRGAPAWVAEGGGHFALVVGGALALFPAGHASNRAGGRRVMTGAMLLAGASMAVLLTASLHPLALLMVLMAFGAFISASNVVAVAAGNRLMPEHGAGVSALLMGLPWCLAAVGPVIAGFLGDPRRGGSPSSAIAWVSICIPLALVAAASFPEGRSLGRAEAMARDLERTE